VLTSLPSISSYSQVTYPLIRRDRAGDEDTRLKLTIAGMAHLNMFVSTIEMFLRVVRALAERRAAASFEARYSRSYGEVQTGPCRVVSGHDDDAMGDSGADKGQGKQSIRWPGWLTAGSLGAVLGDAAINVFSNDLGHRGLAVAAGIAAVVGSATWVRQLPPRSPLAHYSPRILLGLAAAAAAAILLTPRSWTASTTLVAALLVAGSVLIPTDPVTALRLLGGAALIGVGVAAIGYGVAVLRHGGALVSVVFIGVGVATIGYGVAVLRGSGALGGAATIGVGVALIGGGVAVLRHGGALGGAALIGLGVATIGCGMAWLRDSGALGGAATIGVGVALIGGGVAVLRHGGAALIGLGVATIGYGMAWLRDSGALRGAATICGGVALIGCGVDLLHDRDPLGGAATIGLGVATIGFGVAMLGEAGVLGRVGGWLVGLTREPPSATTEDEPGQGGVG
jgi:hypothetical protein